MVKDCQLSVRMIAEETGLDKNAVHRILTRARAKNLSVEQKSELVGNLSRFAGKSRN